MGATKQKVNLAARFERLVDWFLSAELAAADRDTRQRARMFLISHILGPFIGNTVPLALFVVDPTPGYPVAVLAASITGFWVFPFVLKAGARYNLLAFLSIQNLIFCILWSCYFYGGITSPTLAWVLTIPLLAFFYLGASPKLRALVFVLVGANFAGFYGVHLLGHEPVNDTPRTSLQVLGLISTIAASGYVAMMATFYARILASGLELEDEMKKHLETASALRLATTEAERASIAKSEFVARMGHELRTPLNAVIGYSQMLLEDTAEENAAEAADLTRIHSAGHHLLKLVDEVLDLSKIDAGKMELLPASVAVAPLIEGAASAYQDQAGRNGNVLETRLSEGVGTLICDADKVQQALGQLLENAAKFTTDGKITLSATRVRRRGADWIAFTVEDTGIGISAENRAQLFDSFTVGEEDASSSKYGGAGLGLALALKLSRLMGGDIRVESELGKGSAFTIELPVRPAFAAVLDEDEADRAWTEASRAAGAQASPHPAAA